MLSSDDFFFHCWSTCNFYLSTQYTICDDALRNGYCRVIGQEHAGKASISSRLSQICCSCCSIGCCVSLWHERRDEEWSHGGCVVWLSPYVVVMRLLTKWTLGYTFRRRKCVDDRLVQQWCLDASDCWWYQLFEENDSVISQRTGI